MLQPAADRERLRSALLALERDLPGLQNVGASLWNELVDALPRCECGRVIAPVRARRVWSRFCSHRCYRLHHKRADEHRRRFAARDARAMADALYQG